MPQLYKNIIQDLPPNWIIGFIEVYKYLRNGNQIFAYMKFLIKKKLHLLVGYIYMPSHK